MVVRNGGTELWRGPGAPEHFGGKLKPSESFFQAQAFDYDSQVSRKPRHPQAACSHRDYHNKHLDIVLSYLVTHAPHDVATTPRR
jgi:hypothetical protein